MGNEQELKLKLQSIVQRAMAQDQLLREQYEIGKKFRFIHDRLHALSERIQQELSGPAGLTAAKNSEILANEILVYVYVFNAHGQVLRSWQKMLAPSVFYEHSVNRPVYLEKAHVETLVRHKAQPAQHGYITVAIDREGLITEADPKLDQSHNPMVRIKEGSLRFEKMISFTHNGHEYVMDKNGELLRKTNT